jgi:uncharacterized protein YggE
MRLLAAVFSLMFCLDGMASGQITVPGLRRASVRATGQASLSVSPDLARVTVSVETRAATAQEAASQNATQTNALLNILRQFLGANADIKTVGYSLNPIYVYPKDGPPTITGYTATNSLQISLSDLSQVGRLIDIAVQGGATRIQGIQFTLKDPQPVQTRVLREAAAQAKIQAEAIASGLGVRTGGVLWAEESSGVQPVSVDVVRAAPGATTPVEPGLVVVSASVVVELEIR